MDFIPHILLVITGAILLFAVYIIFTRGIPSLWKKQPKHDLRYYIQMVKFLTLLAIAPFSGAVVSTFDHMGIQGIALASTLFISIFIVGMNSLMKDYVWNEMDVVYPEDPDGKN